ncbi:glutathione-dependent formaldehyde-activating enzyme [Mycena polygramma]|nr:glutathione-dependent formaldehyde-activating enzyme [Mycena polygramma]
MSECLQLTLYRGNCHCGAFKFTITTHAQLKQAAMCSCSICSKNGYLWFFPACDDHFAVVKGGEDISLTTFNFEMMAHKFCPTCGTSVMARMHQAFDGKALAINIRVLADVELVTRNGAAREAKSPAPKLAAAEFIPNQMYIYTGGCHCGAVRYQLRSPVKITTVQECNCSSCIRDAALWTYPAATAVTFTALDQLQEYMFGRKFVFHGFCKICGVSICQRFLPNTQRTDIALNARTMDGFDLAILKIQKATGRAWLPAYDV